MKKKILLLTLVGLIGMSAVVYASGIWGTYNGNDVVRLTVNGVPTKVTDVPAINYNSRTMIPIYLLKEAGINYTWDQLNKTVDVIKQSAPMNTPTPASIDKGKLIAYVKAMDYFKLSADLGVNIKELSSSLSTAYDGIGLGTTASLEDQVGFINTCVERYNKNRDLYNSLVPKMNNYGISISGGNDILLKYYDALDYFKKSLSSLEAYNVSKSASDFNDYLSNSGKGFNTAFDAISMANNYYDNFYYTIINY